MDRVMAGLFFWGTISKVRRKISSPVPSRLTGGRRNCLRSRPKAWDSGEADMEHIFWVGLNVVDGESMSAYMHKLDFRRLVKNRINPDLAGKGFP